ncbi:unnamed protein product [Calypogeia fissa]
MWESNENIRKLIPVSVKEMPKTPPIRSKKDERVWKFMLKVKEEAGQRPRATFGHRLRSRQPRTDQWLRKHSKEPVILYGVERCSVKNKPRAACDSLHPPVHGKNSGKNWITVNAVKAIKSKPPKVRPPKEGYVHKKDYGKVPRYLLKRIQEALKQIEDSSDLNGSGPGGGKKCKHPDCRKLGEEERNELIINLKLKWAHLNTAYQAYPSTIDCDSMKFRREKMEEDLAQLERDVQLLSRRVILVSDKPTLNLAPKRKIERHLVSRAIG